jgi:hypothetical protein
VVWGWLGVQSIWAARVAVQRCAGGMGLRDAPDAQLSGHCCDRQIVQQVILSAVICAGFAPDFVSHRAT